MSSSVEHIKIAQQCFQLVGTSQHECDTIPGNNIIILVAYLYMLCIFNVYVLYILIYKYINV